MMKANTQVLFADSKNSLKCYKLVVYIKYSRTYTNIEGFGSFQCFVKYITLNLYIDYDVQFDCTLCDKTCL